MEPSFRSHNRLSWPESFGQEIQRPPVYNAEDYAEYLKKYCKFTGLQLYLNTGTDIPIKTSKSKILFRRIENRDYHADFDNNSNEMGLKQITSISELLNKLKTDLHLSYQSFMKEFISEPNNGVALLLDLLKLVQLSQTSNVGAHKNVDSKMQQVVFKKALADEHECLLCLKLCGETEEGGLSLVNHPTGLFTISVCVMSNFSKSRILSLQLLTKMCFAFNGHKQVSDAMSMLRLRFGEPVRFKFLIGMLNSFNSGAFQIACLRLLNTFVETALSYKERVHIQAEVEEAGFDISQLKKLVSKLGNQSDLLKDELNLWMKNYIDVNALVTERLLIKKSLEKAKDDIKSMRKEYLELEMKHRKLLDEFKAVVTKHKSYEDQWIQMRWVEGGNSDTPSESDSGKHSDNSLVASSEGLWVTSDYRGHSKDLPLSMDSFDSNSSTLPLGNPLQSNQRNVQRNTEQRTSDAQSTQLTPTTENNLDKFLCSEKQETEEEFCNEGINISIISDEHASLATFVETHTSKHKSGKGSAVVDVLNKRPGRISTNKVTLENNNVLETDYNDVPLPPSPKYSNKHKIREKKENVEDKTTVNIPIKDIPRPPVRRRIRSKFTDERPKSAPPQKYQFWQIDNESGRENVLLLQDLSDGETSDAVFNTGTEKSINKNSRDKTLEDAKPTEVFRPSLRLLEREQRKKVKRNKSFFGGEILFGRKNSMIRRAQSFNQIDQPQMSLNEVKNRAKSVDRCLTVADDTYNSMKKSKSMEFLKSKILRRPSNAQRKLGQQDSSTTILGHSIGELNKPPAYKTQNLIPTYSSVYPSVENHQQTAFPKYDWRQDTPFWRQNNVTRKIVVPFDQPPKWVPPIPPSAKTTAIYLPSSEDMRLEITELEDAPLQQSLPEFHHPVKILEMPSGLY